MTTLCTQLCRASAPEASEWYDIALYLPESYRAAFNFIGRRRCNPSSVTLTGKTESGKDVTSVHTWSDFLDLAVTARKNDDADTDETGEYFGNDPGRVRCPVPIDLAACHIPMRPADGETEVAFLPIPVDGCRLFYRDVEHALFTDQVAQHPVTGAHVLPTWSAYLPRMFSAYDQIVDQYLVRKADLVLVKCTARELVFALARHREFAPGSAPVMYLIVGLCYYIASVGVYREQLIVRSSPDVTAPLPIQPLPPSSPDVHASSTSSSSSSSSGRSTPVAREPARKARTPPAGGAAIQERKDKTNRRKEEELRVQWDNQVKWSLPVEWNDHIIPFSVLRFCAVQHCWASTAHWFHYTGVFSRINAYFGHTLNSSRVITHYKMWIQKFTENYARQDPEFKRCPRDGVEQVVRGAVDDAFQKWYIQSKIAATLLAYSNAQGPIDGAEDAANALTARIRVLEAASRAGTTTTTTTTTTATVTTTTTAVRSTSAASMAAVAAATAAVAAKRPLPASAKNVWPRKKRARTGAD